MAKHAKVIRLIREKVRNQEYEFAIPHFFEEMANDDLAFDDIENTIMNGNVNRVFKDDPRGTRYEIVGTATDGRQVAVICRIKETGKLLFITTWEVYE
ncbi:MAG: DUF4258 domain-containing protein [Blastocatellia bacterium]